LVARPHPHGPPVRWLRVRWPPVFEVIRLAGPALELLNFLDSMERSRAVAPLLRSQERYFATPPRRTLERLASQLRSEEHLASPRESREQQRVAPPRWQDRLAPALPASRRLPPAAS
jgi:hypothetical protein